MQRKPRKAIYIITTAIPNKTAQLSAIKTIRHFCKLKDATPVVMTTLPIYKKDEGKFDPDIPKEWFLLKDLHVNANLVVSTIAMRPEVSDPAAGFARATRTDSSLMLASPKQRYKLFPNKGNLPRAVMSPGAITYPEYKNNRTGVLAEKDHRMGAMILEVQDNQVFFPRVVRFAKDGSFIDLDTKYFSNGKTEKVKAVSLTPGDIHAAWMDTNFELCIEEMCQLLKPKFGFYHDVFDAHSINHHHEGKEIYKAQKNRSLIHEGRVTSDLLERHSKWYTKKLNIVKSNHDEALTRYLEELRYTRDYENFEISHLLAIDYFHGHDPFERLSRRFNPLKKVKFLKRTDSIKIGGIENADHGDKGSGGAKGSPKSQEIIHDKVTAGHTHTPEIFNDYYNPGVSARLDMDYVLGTAGTWLHGAVATYENGDRQLLISINGNW